MKSNIARPDPITHNIHIDTLPVENQLIFTLAFSKILC